MNNPIITRCELLLGRMEALEERGTKGEWSVGSGYRVTSPDASHEVTPAHPFCVVCHCGTFCTPNSNTAMANALLISFQHNHSTAESELVRDQINLLADMALAHCNLSSDVEGRIYGRLLASLTRWADSTEAELGKVGA